MDSSTRVEHELAADQTFEACAAHESQKLLVERAVERHDLRHHTRLKTPITLPRICTWVGYSGSSDSFSGWSRMRPFSRKKRFTVASSAASSSPARATTMSPSRAVCCFCTTT